MEQSEGSSYDITKDPKRKPTNSKDPGWKYAYWPKLDKTSIVACGLCHKHLNGGIKRLKEHLVGGYRDAVKCTKTTRAIQDEMQAALLSGRRSKLVFDDQEHELGSCEHPVSVEKDSNEETMQSTTRGPRDSLPAHFGLVLRSRDCFQYSELEKL